jgi:hypothetical protein
LILGSRRDIPLDHQVGEEGSNLFLAHLRRMPFAKEQDKKANPVNVGLLRNRGVKSSYIELFRCSETEGSNLVI